MKLRTLRNALMLAAAAISASLEAPRLAHQPLDTAAQFFDVPASIDSAVEQVAVNVTGSHLGFDTNVYPGDAAMDAWKKSGEYEWVGYYLQAPCHKNSSWSGTRARLVDSGWGLAVIYVGQQTWGRNLDPAAGTARRVTTPSKKSHKGRRTPRARAMVRKSTTPVATTGVGCSASYVNAPQGVLDARDAVARTAAEGFPIGTVVFLDVEHMELIPQRMRDYYRAWSKAVLADGRYRPGIYAHTKNAATIYDDVSEVYAQAGVDGDPPFWVAGSRGFSPSAAPADVGHAFASAWQGMLDVVRTHNGVRLPIDISVASVASPSLASVQ
jgi:hypothetical protein